MFKKILVPTDGSVQAKRAADLAVSLAKEHGAQVVAVSVIDPYPFIGFGDASAIGLQNYISDAKQSADKALQLVSTICEAEGVSFAGDVIENAQVYQGILDTAKTERCDLIVMGSHGHRGLIGMVLGSVAQKVLTHTDVPVLVTKA